MPRSQCSLGALVRVGPTQSTAMISRPGELLPPTLRVTNSSTLMRRLPAIPSNHLRLFRTAARTLMSLIRHSVVSIVVAWLLACIFAYGTHIPELAESPPSYPAVVTTIIVLGTCCLSQASLLVDALAMTSLHRADDPEKHIALKSAWWTLLCRTLPVFIATEVVTALASFAITSGSKSLHPWHLYYYVGNWIIAFFHAASSVEVKRVFQLETAEGLALDHVNKSPYVVRLLVAYVRTSFLPFSMALAATIVHGCLRLAITTNVELVIFSLASVFVKSAILRCTKAIVLSRGVNIDIKRVYVYTVVPTVLINTQVRLFLMRTKPQWSVGGFLLLSILEPAMRVIKIKLLEREMKSRSRLARSSFRLGSTWSLFETIPREFAAKGSRMVVPHPPDATGERSDHHRHPSKLLSDRQAFLQWRATVMQFVAAELEADMCSEYIAIGCSLSINFFFREHDYFGWPLTSQSANGDSVKQTTAEALLASNAGMGLIQVLLEVVVDVGCSMWELRRGVPLHGSPELRPFLMGIFTTCTIATIGVCAGIYVHDTSSEQ